MNSIQFINALHSIYPQIVRTVDGKAYDADGNEVAYDKAAVEAYTQANAYKELRAREYPDFREYLDGVVKGDQAQIDKYIADCLAVKAKYPKGA